MKSTKVQNPRRNKYSAVVETSQGPRDEYSLVAEYRISYRIGPLTIMKGTKVQPSAQQCTVH